MPCRLPVPAIPFWGIAIPRTLGHEDPCKSQERESHDSRNLGIEPEVLKAIYRQMARICAVDRAIQAGLSAGK